MTIGQVQSIFGTPLLRLARSPLNFCVFGKLGRNVLMLTRLIALYLPNPLVTIAKYDRVLWPCQVLPLRGTSRPAVKL